MRFSFYFILFFESLVVLAMDQVLTYDPSVPARFQSLLEITANYLPHDPWNFEKLSIEKNWYIFFKYFSEYSVTKNECEKSISEGEIDLDQMNKIISQRKKLNDYLEEGKTEETDLFPHELMNLLEIARKKGDYRAFVMHCRTLNREALFKLVETRLTLDSKLLDKWEEESYRFEEIYNAMKKHSEEENLRYAKKIHVIPQEFKRSYKRPIPVLVEAKSKGEISVVPPKKKKSNKYSCFPF